MFSARTLSQLEINCQNVEHSFIVFIMMNNNNHNIPKIATPLSNNLRLSQKSTPSFGYQY